VQQLLPALPSSVVYTAEWVAYSVPILYSTGADEYGLLTRELRTHDARREASAESGGAFAGWGLGLGRLWDAGVLARGATCVEW